jgi:hypothetical protein
MYRFATGLALMVSLTLRLSGQSGTSNGEWPSYAGDLSNYR